MIPRPHIDSHGTRFNTLRVRMSAAAVGHLRPLVWVCLAFVASGCGYMLGSPNATEIRSIHVPVFTSDSYRRGIEYQLTEAVQNEIKRRTHFRLQNRQSADTILKGHIVDVRKSVLGETRFDDARENQLSLQIVVSWEDSRSGRMLGQQRIPIGPDMQHLDATADFAPEVGQSLATATQTAVERAATHMVDMLELPW